MTLTARAGRSSIAAAMLVCICSAPLGAQQQSAASIERLLADGWEVAGYVAAWENRTLILFKHREHRYLIQCSVLIDVMRKPRVVTYCNEIR